MQAYASPDVRAISCIYVVIHLQCGAGIRRGEAASVALAAGCSMADARAARGTDSRAWTLGVPSRLYVQKMDVPAQEHLMKVAHSIPNR